MRLTPRDRKMFTTVGLSMGIALAIAPLSRGNWLGAAISFVIGGGIAGVLFVLYSRRADRTLEGEGVPPGDYPVRPILELEIAAGRSDVFSEVREAIRSLANRVTIISASEPTGCISARTHWTRHGAGELLDANITGFGEVVNLALMSRPAWDSTMVDFGRNYRHLFLIQARLAQRFGDRNVVIRQIRSAQAT
jgi:hypothetical protein